MPSACDGDQGIRSWIAVEWMVWKMNLDESDSCAKGRIEILVGRRKNCLDVVEIVAVAVIAVAVLIAAVFEIVGLKY